MSVERRVEFFRHDLGEAERAQILRVLEGPILTTGEATAAAERALADYLGMPHAVCLDSCTAALHLALLAHDVGPGDEVIVPTMTFAATANAVLMAGAAPVFADCDPRTGNVTRASVARCISEQTRAIIPVHVYGLLCDMRGLQALADEHGLVLIEDAAHCIEARDGAVRPGSHSHCACLSFYATKNITCGEGGALLTRDAQLAQRVRRLSQHGLTSSAAERYGKRYRHWDMTELGWKYNLDNIRAALLPTQIERLDRNWARRRELAAYYEAALREVSGVVLPEVSEPATSARHLLAIWVEGADRDAVMAGLHERGVGTTVNYRPVHLLSYYRERFGHRPGDYPHAEWIGERTLSLPFYPGLDEGAVDYVVASLRDVLASLRPVRTLVSV